jgi:hypothetical protein
VVRKCAKRWAGGKGGMQRDTRKQGGHKLNEGVTPTRAGKWVGNWQSKRCSCRRETEGAQTGNGNRGEVQKSVRDHIYRAAQIRPGKGVRLLSTGLVWLGGLLKACEGLSFGVFRCL